MDWLASIQPTLGDYRYPQYHIEMHAIPEYAVNT